MGIDHVEIRAELESAVSRHPAGADSAPYPGARGRGAGASCQAGFATDGDADRIGAVDEQGHFVDANKIYCIL